MASPAHRTQLAIYVRETEPAFIVREVENAPEVSFPKSLTTIEPASPFPAITPGGHVRLTAPEWLFLEKGFLVV